jgi:hypothetical protein
MKNPIVSRRECRSFSINPSRWDEHLDRSLLLGAPLVPVFLCLGQFAHFSGSCGGGACVADQYLHVPRYDLLANLVRAKVSLFRMPGTKLPIHTPVPIFAE